ncbi:MAG: hypothetical protein J6I98_02290, partial [Clostridia bacterium]|nr:hypothetical protein [Clostridia bacterium]
MKILFIGNSYTYYNDLPQLFEKLANVNGKAAEAYSVTCGGRRLIENITKQDEYSEKLDALIKEHDFDWMVLQEQSMGSILEYDTFCAGIAGLRDKLQAHTKQFLLYATWGRKSGSPDLEKHGLTQESMTRKIAEAYEKAGETFGMATAHVGRKFCAVSSVNPEIELYNADKTHPSYAGSCLAALTLYEAVFGEGAEDISAFELPEETGKAFLAQF